MYANLLATSMAMDSRGVIHIVGIASNPAPGTSAVFYINNATDLRNASGFSDPIYLQGYAANPGYGQYFNAQNARVIVDSNDNVHVFWMAQLTLDLSDPQWGPSQILRTKVDIFRKSLTSNGWLPNLESAPTQVTNSNCQLDSEQRYWDLKVCATPAGEVIAIGTRLELTYAWNAVAQQWGSTQSIWNLLCAWNNLLTNGNPATFEAGVALGNVTSRGQAVMAVYVSPSGTETHVVSRRLVNGVWQAPQDECGPAWAAPWGVAFAHGDLDSSGNSHVVFQRGNANTNVLDIYYRFNGGQESQVDIAGVNTSVPRIRVDSRNQVHVLYQGLIAWPAVNNLYHPFYAAMVNGSPGSLDPTWRRQDLIAAPIYDQSEFAAPAGWDSDASIQPVDLHLLMGADDRLHFLTGNTSFYSCTLDYGLGVRDPEAQMSTFPGGNVNVTNGNMQFSLPLFETHGASPNQALGLIYSSLNSEFGSISQGWTLNYEARLIDHGLALNDPTGNYTDQPYEAITVIMPDGRRIVFGFRTYGPGSAYLVAYDEYGFFAKLERSSFVELGTNYVMTFKDGTRWIFNGDGKLRQILNRDGNIINLVHENGRLRYVGDQLNGSRVTTIEWEDVSDQRMPRRIDYISSPSGAIFDFIYTGNRLTGVEFPVAPGSVPVEHEFSYHTTNNASTGARFGLVSFYKTPQGKQDSYGWTLLYWPDGRFKEVRDPSEDYLLDGEDENSTPTSHVAIMSFDYIEAMPAEVEPPQGTLRETMVWDRRGSPNKLSYESRRGLIREIRDWTSLDINGSPRSTPGYGHRARTFDTLGNLILHTDRVGITLAYEYFPRGTTGVGTPHVGDDLQKVLRGLTQLFEFTYSEDEYHQVKTHSVFVDGSERITSYDYFSNGRLMQITYPDAERADGVDQTDVTVSFTYNSRGGIATFTNEENAVTSFTEPNSVTGLPKYLVRSGSQQSTEFAYGPHGHLLKQKLPAGAAGNGATVFSEIVENPFNLPTEIKMGDGVVAAYKHNADSQVTEIHHGGSEAQKSTLLYDKRGFQKGGTRQKDGGGTHGWNQWVDASGNIRRTQNERGYYTHYFYDRLNRLIKTKSEGGTTVSQNGGGGPTWHETLYSHDGYDSQTSKRYTSITRKNTQQEVDDRVTKTIYNSLYRPEEIIHPDEVTKSKQYFNSQGQLIAVETYRGQTLLTCRITRRDARDRVYLERLQSVAYDPQGNDPQQRRDTWTVYNKAGQVIQTVDPRGNVTQTDASAFKTSYKRDSRGRVIAVANGMGHVVAKYVYGDDDNVWETYVPDPTDSEPDFTEEAGGTWGLPDLTFQQPTMVLSKKDQYTGRKEVLSVKNGAGHGLTYAYTSLPGQIDKVTNAAGLVQQTSYYSHSLDVEKVKSGKVTAGNFEADTVRTIHTIRDSNDPAKVTTRVYRDATGSVYSDYVTFADRAGRVERYEAPQMEAWRYYYNSWGELSGLRSAVREEVRNYNRLGQNYETNHTNYFSATVEREFDDAGNASLVEDSRAGRSRTYSSWTGELQSESFRIEGTVWKTVSYTQYDAAGNLVQITDSEGKNHRWERDDAGRVTHVKYDGITVTQNYYLLGGQIWKTVIHNASGSEVANTVNTYDFLGRRTRAVTKHASTIRSDIEWVYNNLDQIVSVIYHHFGLTFEYEYSIFGELTMESTDGNGQGQGGLVVAAVTKEYEYDRRGNRTKLTITTSSGEEVTDYEYDSGARLTTETRGSTSIGYIYSVWGGLSQRTTTVNGSQTDQEQFSYNYQDLANWYAGTNREWEYDHYPTGERLWRVNTYANPDDKQLYVYLGSNVLADYSLIGAGSVTFQGRYSQGLGIDSKSTRIPNSGGRRHYIGDTVGTVSMTLSDSGDAEEKCVRDAWGNELDASNIVERYGFAQREHDYHSDLVHMRHRMYDPRIGRFTQNDPVLQNQPTEHYVFAGSNPVTRTDPLGLFWWWDRVAREWRWEPTDDEPLPTNPFGDGIAKRTFSEPRDGGLWLITKGAIEAHRANASELEAIRWSRASGQVRFWAVFSAEDEVLTKREINRRIYNEKLTNDIITGVGSGVEVAGGIALMATCTPPGIAAGSYLVIDGTSSAAALVDEDYDFMGKGHVEWFGNNAVYSRAVFSLVIGAAGLYGSSFRAVVQGEMYNISTSGRAAEEVAALREYARRVNVWLEKDGPQIVRPTKGALSRESKAMAAEERLRALRANTPYQGQVGHVPDTALSGNPVPPAGWLDMPGFSNQVAGGGLGSRIGKTIRRILIDGKEP